MDILVHRGSHQIGGSCIEIRSRGSRIVLDCGLPLECDSRVAAPLRVPGLFSGTGEPVLGVFLSHAHADHAGLLAASRSDVPVYMTEETSKALLAGSLFAGMPSVERGRMRIIRCRVPVEVGPFRVTALAVDHSVFGAVGYLVEALDGRVFYTGDLRFHGRKPGMRREVIRKLSARTVDALIVEGTRLGSRANEPKLAEAHIERKMAAEMLSSKGLVLAMYSPLNLDRFVSIYRACKRAGRVFVVDPYQAFVLHLISRQVRVPSIGSSRSLLIAIPPWFSRQEVARRLRSTAWMKSLGASRIELDDALRTPEKHVLLFRTSMQKWMWSGVDPSRTNCLYSYWPGYLNQPELQRLRSELESAGGHFVPIHASGHAHPDDLRDFVQAVNPRVLIPVHTETPHAWKRWIPQTRVVADGEVLPLENS